MLFLVGRAVVLVSAVTNVTYRLDAVAVLRSIILFSFYDSWNPVVPLPPEPDGKQNHFVASMCEQFAHHKKIF